MEVNAEDITAIMTLIGKTLPSDLDPVDFKDFGKMTSHIYRSRFYETVKGMVNAGEIQQSSIVVIIYFATLIKNRGRILNAIPALADKYGSTTWLSDAQKFYEEATCQYVSEAEKTKKFPVVNIPSCQPNIAAHFYKQHLKKDKVVRSDEDMFKKFMENLWFPQLRITADLRAKHRAWEENFWNNTVKKSKNPVSDRYERGFNATYYQTKADDDYKFIVNGKEVDTTYDEQAIIAWLKAK